MKYLPILLGNLLFTALNIQAQDAIPLQNPSFESPVADCSEIPEGWINRGNPDELHPSVQPGCHDVETRAFHGKQFLSLVTRMNENVNRIGQKLPGGAMLMRDSLYHVRVYLAYTRELRAKVPGRKKRVRFFGAVMLRIAGYSRKTNIVELLATSPSIVHENWQAYDFVFRPEEDNYDEIIFEAYYNWSQPGAYNGALLIDSISAITKVSTDAVPDGVSGRNIPLANPSFEDEPRCCSAPYGWVNCGPEEESPPDIQPGSFLVNLPAAVGHTYAGLVVRDNQKVESLGQRLPEPLRVGKSYALKAFLARSDRLLSLSRLTGAETNYATPATLRIWGGNAQCSRTELLAETAPITNLQWIEYEITFSPQNGDYHFLILEAGHKSATLLAYNGNLLIDHVRLSNLIK